MNLDGLIDSLALRDLTKEYGREVKDLLDKEYDEEFVEMYEKEIGKNRVERLAVEKE